MSGGYLNYIGADIRRDCETFADDPEIKTRFPQLAALFREIGLWAYAHEHDIDWDMMGDRRLSMSNRAYERDALIALLNIAMRVAPDDLFPRGKWATIQAIEQRADEAREIPT